MSLVHKKHWKQLCDNGQYYQEFGPKGRTDMSFLLFCPSLNRKGTHMGISRKTEQVLSDIRWLIFIRIFNIFLSICLDFYLSCCLNLLFTDGCVTCVVQIFLMLINLFLRYRLRITRKRLFLDSKGHSYPGGWRSQAHILYTGFGKCLEKLPLPKNIF